MAKFNLNDRAPRNPAERKLWLYFLAFRGGCCIAALLAAINLSLNQSLPILIFTYVILVGVDGAHKSTVAWMRIRERQEAEGRRREEAEQAAEQARQEKAMRIRAAQRESSEKYFDEKLLTLGGRAAAVSSETSAE